MSHLALVFIQYTLSIYFCLNCVGSVRILLTDRNKLVMAVGGATALAAGVYTTR